ncbi:MAG: hypothetical protein M0Z71_09380 [Nitrospiraceae bacterium]|nr:hypothetical protein [Nitrospiraceae bacterium]
MSSISVKAALPLILVPIHRDSEATAAPHVKVRQYASLMPLKCGLHAYSMAVREPGKFDNKTRYGVF